MVPLAGTISVANLCHLSEIDYLAGVALSTTLFNFIYFIFGFLRMGTTGVTAQAIGRDDTEAVLGFAPVASAAWHFHSNHILLLAFSLFMAPKVVVLGVQLPRTLKDEPAAVGGQLPDS